MLKKFFMEEMGRGIEIKGGKYKIIKIKREVLYRLIMIIFFKLSIFNLGFCI